LGVNPNIALSYDQEQQTIMVGRFRFRLDIERGRSR
jgi:hypothetical protein